MPLYETVFITRQDLAAEDVDALTEKLSKIVTDGKGKILSKEYWGLKNLAYKIKKNSRGHYVLLNVDAPFATVAKLNENMGYSEDIIRKSIFRVEAFSESSSLLMKAKSAKDYKAGKVENSTMDTSKIDQIVDQTQFEV